MLHVHTWGGMIDLINRLGGEQVEGKVRIIADVSPKVKEKLQEVASARGEYMTDFLVGAIEKEHNKIFKKLKKMDAKEAKK